ncbi:MAG: hypothetical protein CEE42_14440 [Promethearchaeota archaeon Loki_b31]|nr:MAG: hypothetical protein CEE42_14440 [Candidatus Lokiarchaeota archaeon Loki_b31]
MRKNAKSFLISSASLLTILIFASTFLITLNTNNINTTPTPPDFYATSKEVNISEFTNYLKKNEIAVYLPSDLPNKFEMTAIYLKESPFIAIVVYSAESNKDYKTAELGIQISRAKSIPTYNDLSSNIIHAEFEKAFEINGWPVLVNERASSGGESSFIAKYGEYTLLTMVWIEENQYFIVSPTLTTAEVKVLVENMSLMGD